MYISQDIYMYISQDIYICMPRGTNPENVLNLKAKIVPNGF